MRARSHWRQTANWGLTLLAVAGLVAAILSRREDLHPLADVPLASVAIVAVLVVVAHWLNALEFRLLFRAVGAPIGITENWLLFTAGQLLNHLPAQMGTLYRFRYLRVVHNLSYSRATSGYGANLLLTVMATGLLGLIATLLVGITDRQWSPALGLVFIGLLTGSLLMALVPLPRGRKEGQIARAWAGFRAGWSDLQRRRGVAVAVLAIDLIKYLLTAVRLQLTFGWLGYHEPYVFFLVIAPVIGLATFVGLTPAALGVRELSVSGAAVGLGRSFGEGVLGATLDRAVLLGVTLFLGSLGLVVCERRRRRSLASRGERGLGSHPNLGSANSDVLR